jgi:predicted O-methyltransferase YrrM
MSHDGAMTGLRRNIKSLTRSNRFRWLARPARRAWYYFRTVSDLGNVPMFLVGFSKSTRSQPAAGLVEFVFHRFGGMFRPFQSETELRLLIERVAPIRPKTVVEIGTARGGTLFLLSCVADQRARLVSIDLPAGLYGGGYPAWKGLSYRRLMGVQQKLHLIRGNSHEEVTFKKAAHALGGDQVDLLFIDGDHSYEGAKTDFFKYRSLVRPGGLVIFHDILKSKHDHDVNVAPLWQELKKDYHTEELVESYEQGRFGIGVLTAPEHWDSPEVETV